VAWLVALQHLGQHLYNISTADKSDFNDLRLKVVDDSLYLLADYRCWQIVKLLDTKGVLNGYRGDSRCSRAPKLTDKPDVGLDTRSAGSVATCYR
jgi:hypothetical protein